MIKNKKEINKAKVAKALIAKIIKENKEQVLYAMRRNNITNFKPGDDQSIYTAILNGVAASKLFRMDIENLIYKNVKNKGKSIPQWGKGIQWKNATGKTKTLRDISKPVGLMYKSESDCIKEGGTPNAAGNGCDFEPGKEKDDYMFDADGSFPSMEDIMGGTSPMPDDADSGDSFWSQIKPSDITNTLGALGGLFGQNNNTGSSSSSQDSNSSPSSEIADLFLLQQAQAQAAQSKQKGLSGGVIAGIVVGGLAIAGLVTYLIVKK